MNTQELILGLATLASPIFAAWVAWQTRQIASEIKYLRDKLDECVGKSGNSGNSPKRGKSGDNRGKD